MKSILLATFLLFSTNLFASNILVLGLDESGNQIQEQVTEKQYQDILEYELDKVDSSLAEIQKTAPALKSGLKLKTIIVGLGMSGKLQFGPFQISAAVHHRLFYDYVR